MLAARDQENLAFSHQHGAAIKQQGQTTRQLAPKTPGARYAKTPIKVPLNDENGAHTVKGAKHILNENVMTAKASKGGGRPSFVTPMAQRARAVLGDKTTNAKAKGLQTANVKSAVKDVEKSQAKPQNTTRSKQREPQTETQKLQVHAETDSWSEDEVEYCPPRPKDTPYESDVFPDGVLTFDALKPENLMKGYHRYYFNPIDENGLSLRDRQLEEETKRAIEDGKKQIKEDLDNFEWGVTGELETTKPVKAASAAKQPVTRRPLSTIRSRNAADMLSMDDTTNSMQRKVTKPAELGKPLHKKSSSFAMPSLRASRPPSAQRSMIPKKSAKLEATSRTTIGYNKGRATASLLAKASNTSTRPRKDTSASTSTAASSTSTSAHRGVIPRSNTTLSSDSDKTITPASFAHKRSASAAAAVTDDNEWRGRVPFLSIFDPETCGVDDDNEEDLLGVKNKMPDPLDDEDDEFELKLAD
ncbi:hypothetical protein F4861DRAFT_538781 [Xylaria intraflava]|nr:hypothetical protein F4861DRAFT_538781 [Xylaria intraflava]